VAMVRKVMVLAKARLRHVGTCVPAEKLPRHRGSCPPGGQTVRSSCPAVAARQSVGRTRGEGPWGGRCSGPGSSSQSQLRDWLHICL